MWETIEIFQMKSHILIGRIGANTSVRGALMLAFLRVAKLFPTKISYLCASSLDVASSCRVEESCTFGGLNVC